MQPIRLGVIGVGLIWIRAHKPLLETLTDTFVPVAFADMSAERRAAVAREFPDAQVFSEYRDLLALPEVDAVLVLTPIALNAPVAEAALLAGKHVIMEKPIARSVAEGQALIATAQRVGRRLCVLEQMAYRQAETMLAETIAAGTIGTLVLWERVLHLQAAPAPGPLDYESTPWRKQADFPLGTMFDGGIHLIASLTKTFGAPEMVAATGRKLQPEYGEYDHVAALLQYPHGVTGMLSYSSYLPTAQNHFIVYGTAGVIVVERERMTIERPGQPAQVVALPPEDAQQRMWQALEQAFRTQTAPFYTPEKALHDVAILEAIDQSSKASGQGVAVAPVL